MNWFSTRPNRTLGAGLRLSLAALLALAALLPLAGCGGFLLVAAGVTTGASSSSKGGSDGPRNIGRCGNPLDAQIASGGPEGGKVLSLAVQPVPGLPNQNLVRVVAGMDRAGIWFTDLDVRDPGSPVIWNPSSPETAHLTVHALSIEPTTGDPTTIVAGTDEGPYRSTDAGVSWERTPSPKAHFPIFHLIHAPWSPKVVFASTSTDILRSGDGGKTWNESGSPVGEVVVDFAATHGPTPYVFAGTKNNGVWFTWEQNTGWDRMADLTGALGGDDIVALAADLPAVGATMGCRKAVEEGLYVATATAIHYTSDQGNTPWREIPVVLGSDKAIHDLVVTCDELFAHVGNDREPVLSSLKVAALDDVTGAFDVRPLEGIRVHGMVVPPEYPRAIFLGTQGDGVLWNLAEGDPLAWESQNSGLQGHAITTLHVTADNPEGVVVATASGDVFETKNQGADWVRMSQGMRQAHSGFHDILVVPSATFAMYIATELEGLLYVDDLAAGPTLVERVDGVTGLPARALTYNATERRVYAASDGGIFSGVNTPVPGGGPFTRVNTPVAASGFLSLAWDPTVGGLFVGNDRGVVFLLEGASTVISPLIPSGAAVIDLESSPDGHIYAAVQGGLVYRRRAIDLAGPWQSLEACLEVGQVNDLAVDASDPRWIYAATDRGSFRLDTQRQAWDAIRGVEGSLATFSVGVPALSTSTFWAGSGRVVHRFSNLKPE